MGEVIPLRQKQIDRSIANHWERQLQDAKRAVRIAEQALKAMGIEIPEEEIDE